jgi:putative DNA methylase
MMTNAYPKRLIEVDLPIKKISEHARREKSIRHGHISTLHIWWARRPLAACRAVLCAALWPDPADPLCPKEFIITATEQMDRFWNTLDATNYDLSDLTVLRRALLDFIADFANWDNSTDERYLSTARTLTGSAHVALGGQPGTRPLVVDPFAGGGSIPLEALRVGADAFASDLNPVAVLLNKVVLEYIPKYGTELADEVRKWGQWVKEEAEKELAEFYPKDPDGATPIAYLWARTITCENPACGAEVPLMRSLWLAKRKGRSVALKLIPNRDEKRVEFEIVENPKASEVQDGTVARGSATCPICGYTTPVESVRAQLKKRHGGAADARMFCVVTTQHGQQGRSYRLPTEMDLNAARSAADELKRQEIEWSGELSLVPDELLPPVGTLGFRVQQYGIERWGDIFNPRQALSLVCLIRYARKINPSKKDEKFSEAVRSLIALAIDRQADYLTSLVVWANTGEFIAHTFGRQALPIVWEWPECNLWEDGSGNWDGAVGWIVRVIEENIFGNQVHGQIEACSATNHILPDDSVNAFFTDPPYYDAVPYADLSDFFYVWLKRSLSSSAILSGSELTPKKDECIVDPVKNKDKEFFETQMMVSLSEGRRILSPNGIGAVVFAHKSTSGWESQLRAMIKAGWTITASWPIDTERPGRLRAQNSAALASSIHLVCRPRENPDGSLRTEDVGDWGAVLKELPPRIHEWMERLSSENVVGADAIFACLGPALEIYSRYARVEKISGEEVTLGEYLEHVWATVSREALSTIFRDADTEGFEPDARLTAMWLWTLSAGNGDGDGEEAKKSTGYSLEYDTARKIAQGLGAHLDQMPGLVEIKGSEARLLPVRERGAHLFGRGGLSAPQKEKPAGKQLTLGGESVDGAYEAESIRDAATLEFTGETTLDQVHQAMLLFAAGRGDALGRFLREDVGRDPKFAKLAQALSALYPTGSEERRWVDGVLARKKSLGL